MTERSSKSRFASRAGWSYTRDFSAASRRRTRFASALKRENRGPAVRRPHVAGEPWIRLGKESELFQHLLRDAARRKELHGSPGIKLMHFQLELPASP